MVKIKYLSNRSLALKLLIAAGLTSPTLYAQVNVCKDITDPTCGTVRYDVGYSALQARLGSATPTGAGIKVGAIEPPHRAKGDDTKLAWMPLTTFASANVDGKIIVNDSPTLYPEAKSTHATSVAQFFFSNNTSIAPGAINATFYNLGDFSQNHLAVRAPIFASNPLAYRLGIRQRGKIYHRVFENDVNNFSAISHKLAIPTLIRQFDWATEREDAINVISAGNFSTSPSPKVFSSSFNGIYVGITAGTSGRLAAPIDHLYNGNRQRPDVVAPEVHTSNSTAIVSSVAASLLQAARAAPNSGSGKTADDRTIQNAERSEVIKPIIMAGADRSKYNTRKNAYQRDENGEIIKNNKGTAQKMLADITDYRMDERFRTDNGLDTRFGAGQVNISNSYKILEGGEQNSREDGGDESISLFGFDYDDAFGNGTNQTNHNNVASYLLPTLESSAELFVTLAWNLDVYGGDGLFINALLYDLDLCLYKVTGGKDAEINCSKSSNANTETIWQLLDADEQYEFRVTTEKNVTALLWDYGIAWRVEVSGDNQDLLTLDEQPLIENFNIVSQAVPIPGALILFGSSIVALCFGKLHGRESKTTLS